MKSRDLGLRKFHDPPKAEILRLRYAALRMTGVFAFSSTTKETHPRGILALHTSLFTGTFPSPMKHLLPAFLILFAVPSFAADAKVDFNYDIRPIISSKCFHCHGPDEKSRKAKLRLDLRDEALKERDGVRAIVPGDVTASEAVVRVLSQDKDEVMPPPKEGHALNAKEVTLLRKWIEQGAEYKEHWAWSKPVRAEVPRIADLRLPISDWKNGANGFGDWTANPIDAFILQKLAGAKMMPSPEAPPEILLRRITLDLIGLPPTIAQVDEFVQAWQADATPAHRQALISTTADRLLASPAFGERWARMWLDLARYADSTGYGSDFFRMTIWPYRDWVINAFNRNVPFDRFTIEQLGGDLLPDATPEQITATAFHRNTMTNVEGGTIDEEYRVAAVKDRIATTGQVWMGLTVGCAQCHSHKFDPIPQKDYYRFYGVFNQTEDSDRNDEEPKLPLPTAEERTKMETLKTEIAELETKMRTTPPELTAELREWEAKVRTPVPWTVLEPVATKAASLAEVNVLPDHSVLATGMQPRTDLYTVKVAGGLRGISGFRIELLTDPADPKKGPGRFPDGTATLSDLRVNVVPADRDAATARYVRVERADGGFIHLAEVQAFSRGENVALKGKASQSSTYQGAAAARATDGKTEGAYGKKSVQHTDDNDPAPWWEVDLAEAKPIEKIVLWNRTDSGTAARIAGARLVLLDANRKPVFEQKLDQFAAQSSISVDGSKSVALRNASADDEGSGNEAARAIDATSETGWTARGVGQSRVFVVETTQTLDVPEDAQLVFTLNQKQQEMTITRFRLSMTQQPAPVRELTPAIQAILAVEPAQRTEAQTKQLIDYFRPLSRHLADTQKTLDTQRAALAAIKPLAVPVLRELTGDKRRETHLLTKGNYLAPGEKLEPGLLSEFASYVPAETRMDRLAAARWLIDRENPLTARVTVNRFWSQLFGVGIVETEEDFGTQGALPTHPELLDWLAIAFQTPKTDSSSQPSTLNSQPSLGWDVKALLKLIVTSATYQQTSKVSPESLDKDARNRLLSHAPRRRLDAEAVRDQALALSGLLSGKIGGPSVYPPQPDGLWKVAFNGGQNTYPTSKGEDRYRRGIYTFWRRTMPPPSMATFDAPSRESCTVRRTATNTPLQAFVTLNDPVFVECAQALGRRIVREGGADTDARLRFALKLCLARPPADAQVQALASLYENELATYLADEPGALKLATEPIGPLPENASAPELAAWTVVANVLLNLDGVLTKN